MEKSSMFSNALTDLHMYRGSKMTVAHALVQSDWTERLVAWRISWRFFTTFTDPLTTRFTTSFLHFSLFSTALWDLPNSTLVHSLVLSSHLFFCLPCFLLQSQLCVLTLIRCPFPVLQQWHVKDPGHSAKSAGGRLHLNTLTPMSK